MIPQFYVLPGPSQSRYSVTLLLSTELPGPSQAHHCAIPWFYGLPGPSQPHHCVLPWFYGLPGPSQFNHSMISLFYNLPGPSQPHHCVTTWFRGLPGPPKPTVLPSHPSLTFHDPPSRDPTFLSPSRTPQTPPAPPPPGAPGPEDPTWRRAMAAGMQRPPPTPRTPHPRSRRHHAVPRALTEHEHGARAHHGGGDGCKRERGAAAERSGAASHGPHFAPPPQRLAPPTGPPGPIRGRAVGRAANRKRSELSGSGEGR